MARMRSAPAALVVLALLALPPALALRAAGGGAPADLVFVSGPEPETLDPALATAVLETRLLSALFEGLVAIDPATLEPRLAAAEKVAVGDGARRFTFTLRPGLSFSDGAPLGAGDFIYAWRRAAAPETGAPLAREAALVAAGARAVDERTIEIALDAPRPDLLALLALPVFFPVERAVIERYGEAWTRAGHLAGNGPFRLAAWDVGRRLRLERNERWRGPEGGEARLRSIEAITTSGAAVGDATAFQIYETGGADLIFSVPAGGAPRLRGRGDYLERPGLSTAFLRFRCDRAPFSDARVRAALSAAIDRDAIAASVLRNGERPARGLVPPALRGWPEPALASPPAEEVRRPLSARRLEVLYASSDEAAANLAEVLQAAWGAKLGAEVRLRPMERKAFYAAVRAGEYDVAFGSWVADYPDAANFLEILRSGSGNNRTGFADARYDALLDRAAGTTGEARRAALGEAEALLARLAPIAPLYHGTAAVLRRPWVHGYAPNALNLVPWATLSVEGRP
jgi:ABC-type oligopeptide transport system substrate-binding subunit